MNVLVFPGGMPAALGFLAQAQERGERCVGASSLAFDPAAKDYAAWERLPWLGATDFSDSLRTVLDRHEINQIVSAHPAAAAQFREALQSHSRPLPVLEIHADGAGFERPAEVLARAERLYQHPLRLRLAGSERRALSLFEFAALLRQASYIKGSSDETKIEALCEIARWAPAGDVVEIGSAWGKSASVLAWLAGHYKIGALLCIDPWDKAIPLEQGIGTALETWAHGLNRQEMFRDFTLALLPWAGHCRLNYLRMISEQAWQLWPQTNYLVSSAEFGETQYTGRIAVLHVDGHHDFEWAQKDIELWTQALIPGGWLIVDDYRWAFGNGPREAADLWLARKENAVDCCFEAGSALFVRIKP